MAKTFQIKYEKTGFFSRKILIYLDNRPFGIIPDSNLDGVSNINNTFLSVQKNKNVVVDGKTNKIICELHHYSDGSQHIEMDGRSKYLLRKGYTFKNNLVCIQIIENKMEMLEVLADTDIELILYSYFYFKIPTD